MTFQGYFKNTPKGGDVKKEVRRLIVKRFAQGTKHSDMRSERT
jgi:hypothetical protein